MTAGRRTTAYTRLDAAEGAPIGFIWWALPALMRADGVPIERITGLTALLLLPWIFRFAWAPLLAAMYLFIGLFTAASYALCMDLTDPRVAGTQFSTFMAATNGCESWSAFAGGRIAARSGSPASFLAMSVVSLLSLLLLKRLAAPRRRLNP